MRFLLMCFALLLTGGAAAQTPSPATEQTANPELVGRLTRALGATPAQAEGAAGSLFAAAKSRMTAQDWAQVASVVPGISGLLNAAPAGAVGTGGELGALANAVGLGGAGREAGTIAIVAAAFQKLGLNPELVAQAVPVIISYVKQKGGARIAQMLDGALK